MVAGGNVAGGKMKEFRKTREEKRKQMEMREDERRRGMRGKMKIRQRIGKRNPMESTEITKPNMQVNSPYTHHDGLRTGDSEAQDEKLTGLLKLKLTKKTITQIDKEGIRWRTQRWSERNHD
ncbi:hypothetical protein H6P81_016196 [Aristolochia fimbriata]|uniref:Uncharacterized protein n=1 Tax=Aristolochia fimbriata TaxID=158543 RepID=A0AAV7EAP1_ARIFI|nr:hypothetical protein H6P81_016196 [Aristolochia fimbriata]